VAEIVADADPDAAAGRYRQAMTLADELGMLPLVAVCRRGLGLLWRRTGQVAEARAELEAALGLFTELGMKSWQHRTERELAEVSISPR
jgi:hypothetical protein